MKFAGYKRAESDDEAKQTRARFKKYLRENVRDSEMSFFKFDLMMGQRGLIQATRAAKQGDVEGVIVDDLKDLGRDLISLVKTLDALLSAKCVVIILNNDLSIRWERVSEIADRGELPTPEGRMVQALMFAHQKYVSQNRKIGIASAKAAGAQVGRPAGLTLDDVRELIEKLMNANEGDLPSVRDLAKEAVCSIGVAHKLLKQYKTEREQHEQSERRPAQAT